MPELKPNQLYRCDLLAGHWVATDANGQPWQFPVAARGWERRKRYRHGAMELREANNVDAAVAGWPHSGKGGV